jgi:hypothetical protein
MARTRHANDFSPWVGVVNQGPLLSSTNAFRLEHMLAARPSAITPRQATVEPGDAAPGFTLDRTDGGRFSLADFRGKPVVLRLTRAVTDRIV